MEKHFGPGWGAIVVAEFENAMQPKDDGKGGGDQEKVVEVIMEERVCED